VMLGPGNVQVFQQDSPRHAIDGQVVNDQRQLRRRGDPQRAEHRPGGRVQSRPRFDERLAGRKHRYGYFTNGDTESPQNANASKGLLKRDYQTGKTEVQDLGKNLAAGEPLFVPRNAKSSEDDGWVLAVWYDEARDRSEMIVLDAQNFAGAPVARVKLQHRVPWGFHGNWVPAQ